MNNSRKLISAARRAAKNESRRDGTPYQKCLDLIAVRVGRPTWAAFMSDPVPVDEDSLEASLEPDFSSIPSSYHLNSIVGHGRRVGAISFKAFDRKPEGGPPVLDFVLEDGTSRPVDGRGLAIDTLHTFCKNNATPTIDGALMRTCTHPGGPDGRGYHVSGTFDGSMPPKEQRPDTDRHFQDRMHYQEYAPSLSDRIRSKVERWRIGRDAQELNRILSKGGLTLKPEYGPAIAMSPDGKMVRLPHGISMATFSPPGSGRLTGTIVPMLLTGNTSSFVVHDDGQVHRHTSGYRATLGKVAVIRTSGGRTDAITPFGREWLPDGPKTRYLDHVSQALCPHDARVARLVMETAGRLIDRYGETSIERIRDAILIDLDGRLAREAVASLLPLTTPAAMSFTSSRTTILPEDLRGYGPKETCRPFTLYIMRDPLDGNAREPLVAAIQTAIWYQTMRQGPGRMGDDGVKTGYCAVATVFFDFHRSSRLPVLFEMLTYARYHGDSVVVCGSSAASLMQKYKSDDYDILDMFHLTAIPVQSNGTEADMLDRQNNVGYARMRSLPWGKAIFLMGAGLAPELDMPIFFKDKVMRTQAYAEGCTGPAPVG